MWWLALSFSAWRGEPLTLDRVSKRADQAVLEVQLGLAELERSKASLALSRRQYLPQLSLNAESQLQTARFPNPEGGVQAVRQEGTRYDATLSLPIDLNNSIRSTVQAAKAKADAAAWDVEVARADARLAAERSFLEVLRADATKVVAQSSLGTAQAQLDQAESLRSAKTVAPFEVARFSALVKEREADVVRADSAAQVARIQLARLLDCDLEDVKDLTPTEENEAVPNESGLVEVALKSRPELKALDANIAALKNTKSFEAAALRPTGEISAQHQRFVGSAGPFAATEASTLSFTLRWNAFDGGRVREKLRELNADLGQLRLRRSQAVRNIRAEIQAASVELKAAIQRRSVAEAQVSAAREVFRVTKLRRKSGIAVLLEVVDTEAQLRTAETLLVSATYDVRERRAVLRRAIGVTQLAFETLNSTHSEAKK